MGLVWEQVWWAAAVDKLHDELWTRALQPGPVLERHLLLDEAGRTVTLLVETVARAPSGPHQEWGVPLLVRQTPPPPCPPGGDKLALPHP
jgi:hypothetical protein